MTHKIELSELVKQLDVAKIEFPWREVRLMLCAILQKTYETLLTTRQILLSDKDIEILNSWLARRALGEPLSKILGRREFWSHTFKVTFDTLDPRPDSETLIEAVLKYYPNKDWSYKILDLGTGTGCLVISLLMEYKNATGVGGDISEHALRVANENAYNLNVNTRVQWIESSWVDQITDKFDIVISNPPYIREDYPLDKAVSDFDPALALFGGEDGLSAYREIFAGIFPVCHDETMLFFEIGFDQADSVRQIATQHGFKCTEVLKDLGGNDRILVFKLTMSC